MLIHFFLKWHPMDGCNLGKEKAFQKAWEVKEWDNSPPRHHVQDEEIVFASWPCQQFSCASMSASAAVPGEITLWLQTDSWEVQTWSRLPSKAGSEQKVLPYSPQSNLSLLFEKDSLRSASHKTYSSAEWLWATWATSYISKQSLQCYFFPQSSKISRNDERSKK